MSMLSFKYEEEQKRKKRLSKKLELIQRKQVISKQLRIISFLIQPCIFHLRFPNYRISHRAYYANFDREVIGITIFQTDYPKTHFDKFVGDSATYYISQDTKKEIRQNVLQGKYEEYAQLYKSKLSSIQQDLIDRIPSKRKELAELEQLRLANAEEAAKAEKQRKQREAEETARQMEEIKKQEEIAKQETAMRAQQSSIGSLFGAAAASIAPPPTNAKVKEKIVVLHQQGFIEIFQCGG